jgi:hypothetical protein
MTSGEGPTNFEERNCQRQTERQIPDACMNQTYNQTGLLNVASELGILRQETIT